MDTRCPTAGASRPCPGDRTRYDFAQTSQSADAFIQDGAKSLRQQIRQYEFNSGFFSGPIRRVANHVVNGKWTFQSRVRADDDNRNEFFKIDQKMADRFNTQMEAAMKIVHRDSDRRLTHNFWEQLRLVMMAILRDGEVLAIVRESARRGRIIPTCLELLEIDRLQTPMEEINNPNIINGIEVDEEGVPAFYYVLKRHPGDSYQLGLKVDDFDQIRAFNEDGTRKVLHLFDPIRPEQYRAFSRLSSAMKDLQDNDRYREAEILAALEDACLVGIVKSDASLAYQQGVTVDTDDEGNRIHEFSPNMIKYLNPGQDFDMHKPNRPNSQFGETTHNMLSGPANAMDAPQELLFQEWRQMSWSNARTIEVQAQIPFRIHQHYLVNHLCTPFYNSAALKLIALGKVRAPVQFDRRREAFLAHEYIPSGWQWVDPQKEAKGKEIELQNNFTNLAMICASRGLDVEEVLQGTARVLKRIKELEKEHGVKFPMPQSVEEAALETAHGGQDEQNAA